MLPWARGVVTPPSRSLSLSLDGSFVSAPRAVICWKTAACRRRRPAALGITSHLKLLASLSNIVGGLMLGLGLGFFVAKKRSAPPAALSMTQGTADLRRDRLLPLLRERLSPERVDASKCHRRADRRRSASRKVRPVRHRVPASANCRGGLLRSEDRPAGSRAQGTRAQGGRETENYSGQ